MKKGLAWLAACMLILVLAACGGTGQSAESNGESDSGATASEELVIKASNYEFDQPEYHLKKVSRLRLFMKIQTETMVF